MKKSDLARVGVEMAPERTEGVRDGRPVLADGRVLDVANVVWCTGFRQDFSWIDLPVVDEDGWPLERRGVVESAPGLYFVGLAFQFAFASMLVGGAGRDAAYVVKHLVGRTSQASGPAPAASPAGQRRLTADRAGRPAAVRGAREQDGVMDMVPPGCWVHSAAVVGPSPISRPVISRRNAFLPEQSCCRLGESLFLTAS